MCGDRVADHQHRQRSARHTRQHGRSRQARCRCLGHHRRSTRRRPAVELPRRRPARRGDTDHDQSSAEFPPALIASSCSTIASTTRTATPTRYGRQMGSPQQPRPSSMRSYRPSTACSCLTSPEWLDVVRRQARSSDRASTAKYLARKDHLVERTRRVTNPQMVLTLLWWRWRLPSATSTGRHCRSRSLPSNAISLCPTSSSLTCRLRSCLPTPPCMCSAAACLMC